MGHTPIIAPWMLPLDAQIRDLERVRDRPSRWWAPWRRGTRLRAVERLIVLREHALSGEHDVRHAGACPRGTQQCGPKPPPPPLKPAAPR